MRQRISASLTIVTVMSMLSVSPAQAAEEPVAIETLSQQVVSVGQPVSLTGHGFSAVPAENTVTLNGRPATVTSAATDALTFTVPSGATSGPVRVQTPAGAAVSSVDVYLAPAPFLATDVETVRRAEHGVGSVISVSTANRIGLLTFAAQAGRGLGVRLSGGTFGTATSTARVAVYKPDGTALVNPTGFGNAGLFVERRALTQAGSYTILIDPQGAATGQVTVTAFDIPTDVTFAPAFGAATTVATGVPGQNGVVAFNGVVGQRISVQLTASTYGTSSSSARVSVIKPDGTNLIAPTGFGSAGVFLDTTPMPAAGLYQVLIDPQGAASGQVSVTVHDVPADPTATATPGSPVVTLTTTVPGQNATATFTGAAGQRVAWKVTRSASLPSSTSVVVRNPDGTTLASVTSVSTGGTFLDTKVLPAAGAYTVVVNPSGAGTGSLTLETFDVPADVTGTLAVGAPATVTTTVAGQNGTLSFDGVAGQRRAWKVTRDASLSSATSVAVRKPDGSTLVAVTSVSTGGTFIDTVALPLTGAYTIVVDPATWTKGTLTAQMYDVPTDFTAPAPPGSTVTASITTAGQNAVLTFDGAAGDRVAWKFTRGSGLNASTTVTIRNPDGTTLATVASVSTSGTFVDAIVLPATGAYTVIVNPPDWTVGAMTVQTFAVPADAVLATQVGAAEVTSVTTVAGQNASVTFPGTNGQQVNIALTGSTYGAATNVTASLLNPDGTVLAAAVNVSPTGTTIGPVTLGANGTFTVYLNPQGMATGAVAVRVLDAGEATVPATIGGGRVTVGTGTAGQNASVTFPGTAGRRVAVNVTTSTYGAGNLSVSVRRPDGSVLVSAVSVSGERFIDPFVLPVDGTYSVWLDPQGTSTGSVEVELLAVPEDVVLIGQAGQDSVATLSAGQAGTVMFAATAGQHVGFQFTSAGSTADVSFRAYFPGSASSVIATVAPGQTRFIDMGLAGATGDYRVTIDPPGAVAGTFTVRPLLVPDDATVPIVLGGPAVTVTTTVPSQNAAATFTGTAGQRVSVDVTNGGTGWVEVRVRRPDGTSLWTDNLGQGANRFLGPITLPVDGAYSIFINPSDDALANVTLRASDVPPDATASTTIGGPQVILAITAPGQNASVTFTGTAGVPVLAMLDLSAFPSGYLEVKLSNPDGSTRATWSAYGGSSTPVSLGPATLIASGVHTLSIDPFGTATGTLKVRFYDATPPPAVTATIDGPQVRAATTAPGQTVDVIFAGTAGQRVSVVVGDGTFASGYFVAELRHPNGSTVLDSSGVWSSSLLGALVLPVTGTYSVRVDPQGTESGSAAVQVFSVPADLAVDATVGSGHFTVAFPTPGMSATLSFAGTAGQTVSLGANGGSGLVEAEFLNPSGQRLCLFNLSSQSFRSCTTAVAGTHRIRITPLTPATDIWTFELFDGIGAPLVTTSPALGAGQWTSVIEIYCYWRTQATSYIDGYAVVFDRIVDTDPGNVVSQVDDDLWQTLAEEGVHYLHVRAIDDSGRGGPVTHFKIQVSRTPPTMTAVDVPSHPDPDTAVASLDVTAQFSATPSASGIAGYVVAVTRAAADVPQGNPVPGTAFSTRLASEGEWWLHVVAVDNAGNRSAPMHRRLRADVAPSAPVIVSPTHPAPGTAYPPGSFTATWSTGEHRASTWAVALDQSAATVPTTATPEPRYSAQLAAGEWWLHVRGQDQDGTWGDTAHFKVVVAAQSVAFNAPPAGSAVWGSATVSLTCPGAVTVKAAGRDIGTASPVGGGVCEIAWDTTGWEDGLYQLTAPGSGEHPVRVGNGLDGLGRLTSDYSAGLITLENYVRFALYLGLQPDLAPARYTAGAQPPEHAAVTAVVTQLWNALPASVRDELDQWLTPTVIETPPPGIQASIDCGWKVRIKNATYGCIYETANFKVHYIEGMAGPTSPGKPRPDLVQMVGDALEQARTIYHDYMYYRVHEGFKLTVAIDPTMPGNGGISLPGGLNPRGPIMFLHNNTSMTKYFPRHEYFHFVQYEYLNDVWALDPQVYWWMEASAEWAAHKAEFWASDDVGGGYYSALNDYLDRSDERFDRSDTIFASHGPEYGAFIVGEFMEERLGSASIRETWERMQAWNPPPPGEVITEMWQERLAGGFPVEIEKFRQWAYVLDANNTAVGFHDEDADEWRQSAHTPHDTMSLDGLTGPQPRVHTGGYDIEESGAKYVEIVNPQGLDADVTVTWTGDPEVKVSFLFLDSLGKPTGECGNPARLENSSNGYYLLNKTCPRALVTFVYARAPGFWPHEADGTYRIEASRHSAVLTTGTVDIGISKNGNLMSTSGIGLRRAYSIEVSEAIANPSCYCEGWGVGGLLAGRWTGGGVYGTLGWGAGQNLTSREFYSTPTFAQSISDMSNVLSVIQQVSPVNGVQDLFELRILVTNTFSLPVESVRYRRAVGWVPDYARYNYGAYSTFQTFGGNTSFITGVTNDGLSVPDTSKPLGDRGARGWFTDFGPQATGAAVELDLGTLAPGASKSFSLYYGMSMDETQAVAAAQAVGAQAYALGQVPTDEGRGTGRPFTAIFAINGTDLINPPPGPTALWGSPSAQPSSTDFGQPTGSPGAFPARIGLPRRGVGN